ncbi:hypothetical protein BT96DRAFT_515461 [Gymnopus androsaceus JB14]|uniref:Uncharacterized protein n=1 Tax=Gymnopus androsaceus JB14 TaxID=1447944 RepID=A0A6A4I275_9AGAR|nr:hypothetical protein BT96DRAFT_515461 [Gymnopus androsaceus JB14]
MVITASFKPCCTFLFLRKEVFAPREGMSGISSGTRNCASWVPRRTATFYFYSYSFYLSLWFGFTLSEGLQVAPWYSIIASLLLLL